MSASFLRNLCLSLKHFRINKFAVISAYVQAPTAADVGVVYVVSTCLLYFLTVKYIFTIQLFGNKYEPLSIFLLLHSSFPISCSHPLRQQALLAAISEKDANIALLELSSSKRKKAQEEVMALKREKDRLMHQLKQQVHTTHDHQAIYICI